MVYKVALSILLVCGAAIGTEPPKDRIKLELYADGIRMIHQNQYFYAPYTVQTGDTFASLSKKFYDTLEYTVTLSEVNGLSPTQPLEPGTTIYITSDSAILHFTKGQEESQYRVVRDYLRRVKDSTKLTYVWDDADISMALSHEGKWILSKYETAKLRIFDPISQTPQLQLSYSKRSVLEILFGPGTYVTRTVMEAPKVIQ